MTKATSQLTAALRRIDDSWDEQRTERTLPGEHHKQRRRSWQLRGAAAAALVVFAFVAERAWLINARAPLASQAAPAAVDSAPRSEPPLMAAESAALDSASASQPPGTHAVSHLHMQLADGSEVSLRDEHTQLSVSEVTQQRAVLEMRAGQARFDVVHRVERAFVVHCGEVTIEVLGTAFELQRDGARTHVSVLRGRVAVSWSSGRTELSTGEAAWFPRGDSSLPPASSQRARVRAADKPASRHLDAAPPSAASSWREPAERGEFERAYELLRQAPQPVADDVEQLLLAADTARLSGHPEAALPYLRRVVAQHARDSRAPLAAFTLGGVLMQQLGQPREAEAAYARARELASSSPLAEDALARQVEAAHRAGDAALARSLGQEYVAKYPQGRRVHAVRRFAGL
jgi:transmembrane sensor